MGTILNFGLLKKILVDKKFSSRNAKFGAENSHFVGQRKFVGKIEIVSTPFISDGKLLFLS